MTAFSGLCAFPITPTSNEGRVNSDALCRLLSRLVDADVDSIGLLGSTGAYMYLTCEERRRAAEIALQEINGLKPVVVGVSAMRTDDATKIAQHARSVGAAAGLLSPVSYTPLSEDEVFEHFEAVARESRLPIIIYDNPGTTHFQFSDDLVARLARLPGIIGIKNPSSSPGQAVAHYHAQRGSVPNTFSIGYSADWNCTEPLIAGACVWYSVLAGIMPSRCLKIVRAAQAGDAEGARKLNADLEPIWDLFKAYSSLRVVYEMAALLDVAQAEPPLPILGLSQANRRRVAEVLNVVLTNAA